jgi:GNAT superfamily N-acetyltransferase
MMSFAGRDPTQGIPGKEIKAKLTAMWNWVYRRDESYYEQKYRAEGRNPESDRIAAAVAKNGEYIDDLLSRMYAQFGDDELVFPVTAKERDASMCTFTKVPLAQVESVKEFHLAELSLGDLENAVKLTTTVFPNDGDHPKRCFEASLNPNDERNQEYLREIGVDSLKYWVAKDMDGAILGIAGFYTTPYDKADAGWVGWYCVDPKARGLGVGTQLLNRAEEEALSQKKQVLRLYTSDRDTMKTANLQYEKRGYKEIHREPSKTTPGIRIIIRQKDLTSPSTGVPDQSMKLDPENVVVL